MGHRGADLFGDERAFDQGAALVTGGAEAALLAGEGEEEFMTAVRAVEAGETGVEVTAVEKRLDGGSGFCRQAGEVRGVIADDLPDVGGAGLAGAVAGADHPENKPRLRRPRGGQVSAIPKSWYKGSLPAEVMPGPCRRKRIWAPPWAALALDLPTLIRAQVPICRQPSKKAGNGIILLTANPHRRSYVIRRAWATDVGPPMIS